MSKRWGFRRRRLPPAPLLRQETDITERINGGIRQPALMRQRYVFTFYLFYFYGN